MKDKFIKIFLDKLNRIELTAGIVKQDIDEKRIEDSLRLVPIDKVLDKYKCLRITEVRRETLREKRERWF